MTYFICNSDQNIHFLEMGKALDISLGMFWTCHMPYSLDLGMGHGHDFFGDAVNARPIESHVLGTSLFLSDEWHLTTEPNLV